MSEKNRRDVDQEIAKKAATDAAFRKKVLSDPKSVLADMGLSVRDSINVNVVEESESDVYIVLPKAAASAGAGDDLSDDALEAVAAGQFNASCYACGAG
jgi:hypothetical protein